MRWVFRTGLGFLALALALSGVHAASGRISDTALIVGWNILGFNPIPQARVRRIAQVVQRISPDLIVLSEVNPNDVPERIVDELGAGYQQPIILPQDEAVRQNIAFIFKAGVTVTSAQLIPGTNLPEEPGSRRAAVAIVRIGRFDFVLIGVHLKSGRKLAERAKRTRQAHAIARFIAQAVSSSEKDVLVIGDYNMVPRSGNKRNDEVNFFAMSPDNFLRFVSSDFLVGRASHIDSCEPVRGNLLDGFAISRRFTREYLPGSTRLVSFGTLGMSCGFFKRNVSDHLPLVSKFRISRDDD